MTDPTSDFIDQMCAAGAGPARGSDIKDDDVKRRYQLDGDKRGEKNGEYQFKIEDGRGVGWFVNYRDGIKHKFKAPTPDSAPTYTPEQRAQWKAKREAAQAKAKEEQQNIYTENARAAKLIWDKSPAVATHAYLIRKQISAHGVRQHDGKLIIPMYGDGKLWNYQTIDDKGTKRYLKDARKEGCFYPIAHTDDDKSRIIITTGFATAATLREATGHSTIVAFDDSNLPHVCKVMRAKYPDAQIIVAGDNDQWSFASGRKPEGVSRDDYPGDAPEWDAWAADGLLANGGAEAARRSAHIVKGVMVCPDLPRNHKDKPTDFNDMARVLGLDAVRKAIDDIPLPHKEVKKKIVAFDAGEWHEKLLVKSRDQSGKERLEESSFNYSQIIQHHPRLHGMFAWDEFHLCTMIVSPPPWTIDGGFADTFKVHELDDPDVRECDYFIQRLGWKLRGSIDKVRGGIEDAALKNSVHPARDYFNGLQWDGKPRLDNWLIDYLGCIKDDADYVRAVGRTWLLAAVKRIYHPGCKFDHMLILEGPQSAGKSTALRIMATFGEDENARAYFMDTLKISNCEDPDELMKLTGALIVEVQEMSGFNKKDDDALKAFITTTEDTYRAPYGRKTKKWPRQCVLSGTYNPIDGIFKDPTGLRRFWVVATGNKIDLDRLKADRAQIWAEAVHRFKSGEGILLSTEIYQKAEVAASGRRIVDDMTVDVLNAVRGLPFFEVRDVMNALQIPVKGKSQSESRAISKILKVEGFDRVQKSVGGRPTWGWKPPGAIDKPPPETAPMVFDDNDDGEEIVF